MDPAESSCPDSERHNRAPSIAIHQCQRTTWDLIMAFITSKPLFSNTHFAFHCHGFYSYRAPSVKYPISGVDKDGFCWTGYGYAEMVLSLQVCPNTSPGTNCSLFWTLVHRALRKVGNSARTAISPCISGAAGRQLWAPYRSDMQFECTQ